MFEKRNNKMLPNTLMTVLLLMSVPLVASALEDPTRPPSFVGVTGNSEAEQSQLPVWQVNSILISNERRVAVVNGRTVKQGDQINSARVIRISPTAVTLRNSAETFTVKLLPLQIKSVREK